MNTKLQNYDNSLAYIRVISMLMILICHVANKLSIGAVAQLFQVGVQIFLLISGYLCAMKTPSSISKWLLSRTKRIFIPIWLFSIVIVLIFVWTNHEVLLNILPSFFGVYGIAHIVTFLELPTVMGFEHLWYITPLIISYLFIIFVYRYKKLINNVVLFCGLTALQLILAIVKIRIDFIVIFFVGYILYSLLEKSKKSILIVSNIGAIIFTATRFIMSRSENFSSGHIYLFYVIPLCYNFLAVAIFCDAKFVLEKIKPWNIKWLDRINAHLDSVSYEVYIAHYIFIEGLLSVYAVIDSTALSTIAFLAASFVAAEILHCMVKTVNRFVVRSK